MVSHIPCGDNGKTGRVASGQHHFFTPVAQDIAPERGSSCIIGLQVICFSFIVKVRKYPFQLLAGGVVLRERHIQSGASHRMDHITAQRGSPPEGFGREGPFCPCEQFPITSVKLVIVHRGKILHSPLSRVKCSTHATPHIGRCRHIMCGEEFSGLNIPCSHTQGIALLDKEMLQTGMVGVNVGQTMAVAVGDTLCLYNLGSIVINHIADFYEFIFSVTVGIGRAHLMGLILLRIAGKAVGILQLQLAVNKPPRRVCPCKEARGLAVFVLIDQRRVYAVEIIDDKMSSNVFPLV